MPHLVTGPLLCGAGGFFFCELSVRSSTGGPGPVSVWLHIDANIDLPRHALVERPRSASQVMSSTPHTYQRLLQPSEPFWLIRPCRFWRSRALQIWAKKPVPAASTGRRSGHSGTLQETTGGTQTHSRRTVLKLGRLHRARQAIVRVPESNTKYGAKYRKPEAPSPLESGQLSVSPQGFPRKKVRVFSAPRASPRCSQENFLLRPVAIQGIALRRLTWICGGVGQACPPIDGQRRR